MVAQPGDRTVTTAPLQVIAVSFRNGAAAQDQILAEVDRLRGRGVLRLLDLLIVAKSPDGSVEQVSVGDDEDFGSLLAAVVPMAGGGPDGPAGPTSQAGAAAFDPATAWALADSLEPGTALAYLLVEHLWAGPLFEVIAEAGGALIGAGFLSEQTEAVVGAELAAMEEAAQVIAAAQAAEAQAVLRAAAADAAAARAVADAQRIQEAAAADAVRALIAAGVVEEAAAHEAVTALHAAGLMVSAVDQAAAASLEESLARIAAADEVAQEAAAEAAEQVRAASITPAEAQVLRYLPQPITFAVIAAKLGISRSAAKERASQLYQRLGVHSRADAVARARQLRLLRG